MGFGFPSGMLIFLIGLCMPEPGYHCGHRVRAPDVEVNLGTAPTGKSWIHTYVYIYIYSIYIYIYYIDSRQCCPYFWLLLCGGRYPKVRVWHQGFGKGLSKACRVFK